MTDLEHDLLQHVVGHVIENFAFVDEILELPTGKVAPVKYVVFSLSEGCYLAFPASSYVRLGTTAENNGDQLPD